MNVSPDIEVIRVFRRVYTRGGVGAHDTFLGKKSVYAVYLALVTVLVRKKALNY